MRRRQPIEEPEQRDRWIIPYADFITLLFALFAVLYAISAVDVSRFQRVSVGIRSALSSGPSVRARPSDEGLPASRTPLGSSWARADEPSLPLAAVRDRVEAALEAEVPPEELRHFVNLEVEDRGLVISLAADVLFDEGTARLRPEGLALLDVIAGELATLDASLRVEAHTDPGDRASAPFASTWELSAARASTVVRSLVERGGLEAEVLSAAGYAGMRPLSPERSEEDRARNRRLDLVVLSAREASSEPRSPGRRRSLTRALERLPEPGATPPASEAAE